MQLTMVQYIAVAIIPILFAITFHELAHGWVAWKFGDPTAKMLGRISFNPIRHIDPVGTVLVPALLLSMGGFLFGWAKPVPVDPRNFKNPKQVMIYVAAAGPLSNLLMAFMWGALLKVSFLLHGVDNWLAIPLQAMSQIGVQINLVLMVLNFIPIPPLDGSKVLMGLLPGRAAYQLSLLEPYGLFIILALVYLGIFNMILSPFMQFFTAVISNVFGL